MCVTINCTREVVNINIGYCVIADQSCVKNAGWECSSYSHYSCFKHSIPNVSRGSDNYLTFGKSILCYVLAMLAWTANGASYPEIYA